MRPRWPSVGERASLEMEITPFLTMGVQNITLLLPSKFF